MKRVITVVDKIFRSEVESIELIPHFHRALERTVTSVILSVEVSKYINGDIDEREMLGGICGERSTEGRWRLQAEEGRSHGSLYLNQRANRVPDVSQKRQFLGMLYFTVCVRVHVANLSPASFLSRDPLSLSSQSNPFGMMQAATQ